MQVSSGHWHVEDLRQNDSKVNNETNKKSNPKNGIAKPSEQVNGFNSVNGHCNSSQPKLPAKKTPNGSLKITPKKSESVTKKVVNNSLPNVKSPKKLVNTSIPCVQFSPLLSLQNKMNDAITSTPNTKTHLKTDSKADKANSTNTSINKAMKSPKEINTPKIISKSIQKQLVSTGEDTEIIIPIKKNLKVDNRLNKSDFISRIKSKKTALLCANLSVDNLTPLKKVNIALAKNTSHGVVDYFTSVLQSPEVPFDSRKKPVKTSLKPNSMPSPVNPFYKRKLK